MTESIPHFRGFAISAFMPGKIGLTRVDGHSPKDLNENISKKWIRSFEPFEDRLTDIGNEIVEAVREQRQDNKNLHCSKYRVPIVIGWPKDTLISNFDRRLERYSGVTLEEVRTVPEVMKVLAGLLVPMTCGGVTLDEVDYQPRGFTKAELHNPLAYKASEALYGPFKPAIEEGLNHYAKGNHNKAYEILKAVTIKYADIFSDQLKIHSEFLGSRFMQFGTALKDPKLFTFLKLFDLTSAMEERVKQNLNLKHNIKIKLTNDIPSAQYVDVCRVYMRDQMQALGHLNRLFKLGSIPL